MRKPNLKGCIPSGDVCLKHDQPLICRHGCSEAKAHKCNDLELPELEECPLCGAEITGDDKHFHTIL